MSESMEDLLKGVARKWAMRDNHPLREPPEAIEHDTEVHFERLRESGLLRLLEAGQALAQMPDERYFTACSGEWDASLAAMEEKIR